MRKSRAHGETLEARRLRVWNGRCLGKSVYDLADEEKVHWSQICRDVSAVARKLGRKLKPKDVEKVRLELLGKTFHAEAELLAAWERSKRPKERKKAKRIDAQAATGKSKGKPGKTEAEHVTEGRDGNPKFMAELRANWELQAKLLSLIVQKIAPTDPSGEKPYKLAIEAVVKARQAVSEYRDERTNESGD